ncbi:MAG TPA: hypothetical protein VFR12_06775 [Pyrinomonadaceae bacterium]|nr:hypothetical protein [Pyrinomonadaceae bacterium]
MEVIRVLDRPASQGFYAVAGRLLFVESTDLRLGTLIERLFAGWQLTPVTSPANSPDIRITFRCGETLPQIPADLNQFEIAEGGRCYTDGAGYYLALGNSVLQLRNGTPITVSISLSDVPATEDPLLARVTSFAVCAALRRFGLFELHSASVVHPESEKGVLIIGPSGSGKSTLALQLTLAGWPYLSDDELLLSLVDDLVEARGFRSFFAVTSATASAVGIDKIAEVSERAKTCFEPDAVFGSSQRTSAVPGALFFVGLSGKETTEVVKLTQAETMTRLIRSCPWATYDTAIASANLNVLSKLARQTSAFDLRAGRDLLEPNHASELLSRYVEA